MSAALVNITYVTPAAIKAAPSAACRSIAGMPGFEWVGLLPASQLTDAFLAELCNLVNGSTGATPPAA